MAEAESLYLPNNMPVSLPSCPPQPFTGPALSLGYLVSTPSSELSDQLCSQKMEIQKAAERFFFRMQ